jgi:hypothetical protein
MTDSPLPISTLIGAQQEDEAVLLQHQNSRGIDYVTHQLRSFWQKLHLAGLHGRFRMKYTVLIPTGNHRETIKSFRN